MRENIRDENRGLVFDKQYADENMRERENYRD